MPKHPPKYFVRVCNYADYQHYKASRNKPPWIKWYIACLTSWRFTTLADGQKWHCVGLALLASRTENHIPADTRWLKRELHATGRVDLEPLIKAGFVEWCDCRECRGLKSAPIYPVVLLPEGE